MSNDDKLEIQQVSNGTCRMINDRIFAIAEKKEVIIKGMSNDTENRPLIHFVAFDHST